MAKLTNTQRKEKFKKEVERKEALHQKAEIAKEKEKLRVGALDTEIANINRDFKYGALLDFVDLDEFFVTTERLQDIDPDKSYADLIDEYSKLGRILQDIEEQDQLYDKELKNGFNIDLNKDEADYHERQLKIYQTYFQAMIPRYNYYTCSCCGQPKRINHYYYNHSLSNMGRLDVMGLQRGNICIECSKKIFEYYFLKEADQNPKKAMIKYCSDTNTYWDESILTDSLNLIQSTGETTHVLDIYHNQLFKERYGKTFFDSVLEMEASGASFSGDYKDSEESKLIQTTFSGFGGKTDQMDKFVDFNGDVVYWPKEDVKNLKKTIKMIGYDPFYYIEDENARRNLYSDFLSILDIDMQFDLDVKSTYKQVTFTVTCSKRFPLNCWKILKQIILQHKHEKC